MMASNAELHSFICLPQFMDLSPKSSQMSYIGSILKIQSTPKLPEHYLLIGV